ncbi:hypothetical protein J4230_04690 [Candidatus Woesearchaeota archaeon]|nr:hypothetical protein [Candidatus Woesearchaeota archaeon]
MEHLRNKIKLKDDSDFSVTYKLNKTNGIFNWYPYTEGFSKPFVDKMLSHFGVEKNNLVMDPFSGCGTTALACTLNGYKSISIEVNPFMHFVGKIKVNSLILNSVNIRKYHSDIKNRINQNSNKDVPSPPFLIGRHFFNVENLKQALIIKEAINKSVSDDKYKEFFLLHLSSILVKISDMVRAVDLRYKKTKQNKLDVYELFNQKIEKSIKDLNHVGDVSIPKNHFYNEDICNMGDHLNQFIGKIDFLITSPPYLNGTNYDRNTKLEMGFLEMIKSDEDLKNLRTKMIIAGINSTHTNNKYKKELKFLDDLIEKVKTNAYDRRIPIMVKGYFNDMNLALENISNLMKEGGRGVFVIGDSQFGGVYIETDLILAKICELNSLKVESIDVVRERRSKNGMKLRESLIFVVKK